MLSQFSNIKVPHVKAAKTASRLWREWCFARVVWRHVRWRILLLLGILLVGGLMFRIFEPQDGHSFVEAIWFTFLLIFGEPPEDLPASPALQIMFFLIPLLGLLVILEGIVDFSLVLRDRRRNERNWCIVMAASLSNHVVLVGLGKLGFRTYRLLRKLQVPVLVIERDEDSPFLSEVRRDGNPLFIGDACREDLLHDANIQNAKSIILATDDDLANLETALDARKLNPTIHVVMRMFDQNMADKIRDGFGVKTAMSQSAISAPAFVMAAVEDSIVSTTVINDELVVTQKWFVRADGPLCHKTVCQIMEEFSVGVVQRKPTGEEAQLFPPPDTRTCVGDELLVQGKYETLVTLQEQSDMTTLEKQNGNGIATNNSQK